MGRPSNTLYEDKPWSLQNIQPHHRSMARDFVRGARTNEVAVKYGFSAAQIAIIKNSPLFKAEMARIEAMADAGTAETRRELESLQPRALEVIAEDLFQDGVDRNLRNKTAFELLAVTGFSKNNGVSQHQHVHFHQHEEVERLSREELYNEVIDLVQDDAT